MIINIIIFNYVKFMIILMILFLTNFHTFKIELYDKHILNNLCERTNKIIKSLCHYDTKPFKLDYYINVIKDKFISIG